MAEKELNTFAQNVLKSKLVDRSTLKKQLRDFQENSEAAKTVQGLAKFLIRRNLITKYQARRILAGRTAGFFLGGCRILDRLGEGGMGVVYLAMQERLQRKVALKVLPFRGDVDNDAIKRFYREARAAAALKHTNIVQVFDVNREQDTHFIIMELVAGKNLTQIIKQQGPFSIGKSFLLIRQAAEGLAHAHTSGIVHRDIKPANLVLEDATLKILDLGLARQESDEQITADQALLGTPDYMSPEQCQGAEGVDQRSDIYSLGCTWYHLLIGKPPLASQPITGKLLSHTTGKLPSVSDSAANVPSDIVRIIARMTARLKDDRYQTAAELIADLDTVEQHWEQETLVASDIVAPAPADSAVTESDNRDFSDSDSNNSDLEATDDPASDYETIVHVPAESGYVSMTWLVPLMGALVLGGVYFGIQLIKDRLPNSETIVIDVPASKPAQSEVQQNSTSPNSSSQKASGNTSLPVDSTDVNSSSEPKTTSDAERAVESTKANASPATHIAVEPAGAKKSATDRDPAGMTTDPQEKIAANVGVNSMDNAAIEVARRAPKEIVLTEFTDSWDNDLVDGDVLKLTSRGTYELNSPIRLETSLTIKGTQANRALVYIETAESPHMWMQSDSSLTLQDVDLYVDLRRSNLSAFTIFDLNTADLHLKNSSLTVIPSAQARWEELSFIRINGARLWDRSARGDAPEPLKVTIDNTFIRGVGTVIRNLSTQSVCSITNSIVTGTGPVVHAFHRTPREYAHQTMDMQVRNCSLDTEQPFLTIDCRPFDLRPVPMHVDCRDSVLLTMGAVPAEAPIIYWSSPVESNSVADSVAYVGENNLYFRRKYACLVKSSDGEIRTLVDQPQDWKRQQLGDDAKSAFLDFDSTARATKWHERNARDYSANAWLRRSVGTTVKLTLPGADVKSFKPPRRLPTGLEKQRR